MTGSVKTGMTKSQSALSFCVPLHVLVVLPRISKVDLFFVPNGPITLIGVFILTSRNAPDNVEATGWFLDS